MTRRTMMGLLGAAGAASAQRTKRRNVIFILSDDHRYDALGFLKAEPWLKTPQLDRLAAEGAHFKNAFVTTALCSPSRASILTGMLGLQPKLTTGEAIVWLAYVVPMTLYVLWPSRRTRPARAAALEGSTA